MGFFNKIIKAGKDAVNDVISGKVKTGNSTVDNALNIVNEVLDSSKSHGSTSSNSNTRQPTKSTVVTSQPTKPTKQSVRGRFGHSLTAVNTLAPKAPTEKKYFGMSLPSAIITGLGLFVSVLGLYFTIKKK